MNSAIDSAVSMGVGAREGLQRLVRAWDNPRGAERSGCPSATTAQLFSRSRSSAASFRITLFNPRSSAQQTDQRVAHRHADVAQHGRVREVALQTRHGELRRQMAVYGARDAEGCPRHSRNRSDSPCGAWRSIPTSPGLIRCLEVLLRNVHPHVAAQVGEDRVDAAQVVEDGRQVVVMLDLRGVARAAEPQRLVHETVGERRPVIAG